jgi:hypothetical protein
LFAASFNEDASENQTLEGFELYNSDKHDLSEAKSLPDRYTEFVEQTGALPQISFRFVT